MADNTQDKTEQPTPRKLQEARKKGQAPKSRDLSSALVLVVSVFTCLIMIRTIIATMERLFTWYYSSFAFFNLQEGSLFRVVQVVLLQVAVLIIPLFLIIIGFSIFANIIQSGLIISTEALKPKLEKLNPIEGLKKMFSIQSLVELVKSIFKVIIVGTASCMVAVKYIPGLLTMYNRTPGQELFQVATILTVLGITGGGAYLLLSVGDMFFQRWEFMKSMRMSKQEVKDEYKQTEGDPQIKGWQRKRQREVVMNRIRQEVPRATVVITNPIHYAVALRYEKGGIAAPAVVAKGAGDIALKLKEIAKAHSIPVIENPPLAGMLFRQVDPGQEIPVELYKAVAEVLAMVIRLKNQTGTW